MLRFYTDAYSNGQLEVPNSSRRSKSTELSENRVLYLCRAFTTYPGLHISMYANTRCRLGLTVTYYYLLLSTHSQRNHFFSHSKSNGSILIQWKMGLFPKTEKEKKEGKHTSTNPNRYQDY